MLTLGSLFDGIGGWQLAAVHAGVVPVWSCEIDPYPAAVTAYHFPKTTQLGDITKINGGKIVPVDIICAGSPCQNLSQAGNRKGLQGKESSLFYESIRIVKEMRRRTNGRYPRFFVWENVTGAFTSNHGSDFQSVLQTIGQTSIPMPESGRWAYAGLAELPTCQIAWRTLDSQFWGVPQRRRRIFLVADFAESNRCSGEILFIEKRLPGDSSESGGKEQGSSNGVRASTKRPIRVIPTRKTYDVRLSSLNTNKASARYTIYATDKSRTLNTQASDPNGQQGGIAIVENIEMYDIAHRSEVVRTMHGDKVNTLTSRMGTGGNNVPILHDKEIRRVRKLTPVECERLQGLPDDWTNIVFNGKPASDSRRYKAIGNGMAQPCADFVIRQLVAAIK